MNLPLIMCQLMSSCPGATLRNGIEARALYRGRDGRNLEIVQRWAGQASFASVHCQMRKVDMDWWTEPQHGISDCAGQMKISASVIAKRSDSDTFNRSSVGGSHPSAEFVVPTLTAGRRDILAAKDRQRAPKASEIDDRRTFRLQESLQNSCNRWCTLRQASVASWAMEEAGIAVKRKDQVRSCGWIA